MLRNVSLTVLFSMVVSSAGAGCGGGGPRQEDGDVTGEPDVAQEDARGEPDVAREDSRDGPGTPDAEPDLADIQDLPADDGGVLSSRIMADPDNPRWLKHEDNGPFFMCGPGDPEDFLYRGTLNPDGTRDGDQMAIIDKLKTTGANSLYFQAIRSHGGDGGETHNPFIDHDPASGINDAVLDQWETWFAEMDENGVVIFFFFYDDGARVWDTGDSVGADERAFIQSLVDRFEHHNYLIWAIAEEYQESFSAARVSNIAAEVRAADDNDHVVAVHKLSGLDFSEFADDPDLDQFAIQYNVDTASQLHDGMVSAWNEAAGRYNLNMSEAANYGAGATARRKSWAVALGGAYVMVLGWDVVSTAVEDLQDCGRLVAFMESTSFNEMAPHDELASGGTQYVMALPGDSYIAYASSLSGDIGLTGMTAGSYDFLWLDIPTGNVAARDRVSVGAGDQSWTPPDGMGRELAVYIKASP